MKRTTVLLSLVALQLLQAQPGQLQLTIVNSASFQPGMPHGGSLATIFITPGPTGWPAKPGIYASSTPLAPALQNFQVLVNGAVAPILAVVVPSDPTASAQINIQVPLERNATLGDIMFFNGTCNANIGTGGCGPSPGGSLIVGSATLSPLPNAGLGGFFQDANGFLVAEHASDYSAVTLENPAHAGEQIIAFADDFFPVWPSPPIGVSAPSAYSADPDPPQELVGQWTYLYLQQYAPNPTCNNVPECGGVYTYTTTPAITINAETLAPNTVGVEQIIFTVPTNQQPGDWALFFNNGSCPDGRGAPCPGRTQGSFSSPFAKLPVR